MGWEVLAESTSSFVWIVVALVWVAASESA
jgi:hypothetical protein